MIKLKDILNELSVVFEESDSVIDEMKKKKSNVLVTSKECRGNHERMIRRFLKKTKKEKIIEQIRDKRYYKKPSVKKREERAKAERRRAREELKKIRALERRNRKK